MAKRKKLTASQMFDQSIQIGKAKSKAAKLQAELDNIKNNADSVEVNKLIKIKNYMKNIYSNPRAGHYESGNTGRWDNDWLTSTNTPYNDIAGGLQKSIARSRRLVSNSGFASNAVTCLLDNIVCDGLRPIPVVKKADGTLNEKLNKGLREVWSRFNDQFDRTGRSTFYECQRLALETIIVSGSVITNQVRSKNGSLLPIAYQMREPDRLDSGKDFTTKSIDNNTEIRQTCHGINLDQYDVPVSYWFNGIEKPIDARFIIHAFKRHRPEQYTGVPWFIATLKRMYDVQNLIEDQAIKSRIAAMIALWFESENGLPGIGPQDSSDDTFQWYPGSVGRGPAGSKPQVIQAEDLEGGYTALIKLLLREAAATVGISYYSIARDIEGMNFAGTRAVILDERRMYTAAQKWFSKEFCQPHYNEFVKWCAVTGAVKGLTADLYMRDQHRFNECYWVAKPWEWVDPVKDVTALIKLKDAGWYTDEMYLAARGIGLGEFYQQLKTEKELKDKLGIVTPITDQSNTDDNNVDGDEPDQDDPGEDDNMLNIYKGGI